MPATPTRRFFTRKHSVPVLALGAVTILALTAGLTALALQAVPEQPRAAMRPVMTVSLEPPQTLRWERALAAHGAIEPWQEQIVGARVAGLSLADVFVEVGDTVRRGALLARFDASLPRAEVAQLEAALVQAQASARHAAAVRDRMVQLSESGAVSKQDLQQSQSQAATTGAQVAVVQAQLAAKQLLLNYAEVRAPDDGVVSARMVAPGAVASAGQELFRIIRQRRLEWRAELTPLQLAQVRAGQSVVLELPGGGIARAQISRDAPRLDPQTRLATVYAEIATDSPARAGMYAGGRILLGPSDALTVSAHSVLVRDGRSLVFVADPGKQPTLARAIPVTVGRRQGARSEIVSPLPPGMQVIGQGAAFLKDGDQVRVGPARQTAATAEQQT